MAIKTNKLVNSVNNKELSIGELVKNDGGIIKDIDNNAVLDIKTNNNLLTNALGDGIRIKVATAQNDDEAVSLGQVADVIVHNAENSYKFSGYEKDSFVGAYGRKIKFKKLINTQRSFPERWMIGVGYDNQLIFWGYKNSFFDGNCNKDALGAVVLQVPEEIRGIEPKEIVPTTWGIYVLYPNGDLYVMGYNGYGQLGTGNTTHQPYILKKVLDNVIKVATSSHGYHQNHNSVLVLREINGVREVWGTGRDNFGQLARNSTADYRTTFEKCIFTPELEFTDKIIDIFVNSTYAVSCYALTDTGKLFATGYNANGELGLGDTDNRSIFTRVMGALEDERVVEVVTGGGTRSGNTAYHRTSVVVRCESGALYSWGYGGNGELGIGSGGNQSLPQRITFFDGKNVVKLYGFRGSWTNYFAKLNNGEVYGWGYNHYGSLGIGTTNTNIQLPQKVLINEPIEDVYLGAGSGTYCYHHATMFITQSNKIYLTGYGGEGQCGDYNNNHHTPILRSLPSDPSIRIKQVATGGYSQAWAWYILLENGDVYAWGDNDYQTCRMFDSCGWVANPSLVGI